MYIYLIYFEKCHISRVTNNFHQCDIGDIVLVVYLVGGVWASCEGISFTAKNIRMRFFTAKIKTQIKTCVPIMHLFLLCTHVVLHVIVFFRLKDVKMYYNAILLNICV